MPWLRHPFGNPTTLEALFRFALQSETSGARGFAPLAYAKFALRLHHVAAEPRTRLPGLSHCNFVRGYFKRSAKLYHTTDEIIKGAFTQFCL